jgi:hypothetical protein
LTLHLKTPAHELAWFSERLQVQTLDTEDMCEAGYIAFSASLNF